MSLAKAAGVAGSLVLDGILNVASLTGFGTPQAGDRWRLFNYVTSLTDNGLDLGTLPGLVSTSLAYFVDVSAFGRVDLVVGAIPEPSALLLVLLGAAGVGVFWTRRR